MGVTPAPIKGKIAEIVCYKMVQKRAKISVFGPKILSRSSKHFLDYLDTFHIIRAHFLVYPDTFYTFYIMQTHFLDYTDTF